GLIALQEEPPPQAAAFLGRSAAIDTLDYVHLACLARGWAAVHHQPGEGAADAVLARIERCRSADRGYATAAGAATGSAYAAFLAVGAYQDLARAVPDPAGVLASMGALKAADGSYGNQRDLPSGLTTATAAAVIVMRQLGAAPDRDAGMWLLDRCHTSGGFFASRGAPIPDLLSTATALHALSSLHVPIGGLRESCLDFVDSLWTNRGGFFGSWADDTVDCEYTYYALLALGHLSLDPS
ncbi:MAG: hypothetical protein L0271_01615, partial [Gemmatimonadetes bacterium]|nr:hypothetical protein [Gemmatimonadota bacterium]